MVCFSEIQAMSVLDAARSLNLIRGREFEVVCFSDNPGESPPEGMAGFCVVPWRKIAEAATDMVLQRIDKPQSKPSRVVFSPEVIEANSRK